MAPEWVRRLIPPSESLLGLLPGGVGEEDPAAHWPLITPALFSHRPPPDREKREKGKTVLAGLIPVSDRMVVTVRSVREDS
jgi:hypothetical protein